MYEKFNAVSKEKQESVISAAIAIFGAGGYVKANTSEICEQAGISKGLLFHYFGSKKNLFLFLVDYITEDMSKRYYSQMKKMPMELFELLTESTMIKLKIAAEIPMAYKIIYEAYVNPPSELKNDLEEKLSGLFSNQKELFAQMVDVSLFKDEITPKRGIDLIWACSKGLYDLYLEDLKKMTAEETLSNMEWIKEDMMAHFAILKTALYK